MPHNRAESNRNDGVLKYIRLLTDTNVCWFNERSAQVFGRGGAERDSLVDSTETAIALINMRRGKKTHPVCVREPRGKKPYAYHMWEQRSMMCQHSEQQAASTVMNC